ncbi:hypothetical protein DRO27_05745 [Candidatus Bathyarchaeota archaeon]|nr:MAG: hypothetical protein DRO27_05745 [Candidatus Bathyarchaeota archaeon]
MEVIAKTSRYTRDCPNIDRGASIRGSLKALDHTYSSTEMRRGWVSNLTDAGEGLQLALRGRIRLRADLLGFDDREAALMAQTARAVEDVMWYAVRDVGQKVLAGFEGDMSALPEEVDSLLASRGSIREGLEASTSVSEALDLMDEIGPSDPDQLVDGLEDQLRNRIEGAEPDVIEEYRFSALELLANALLASETVSSFSSQSRIFVPRRMET